MIKLLRNYNFAKEHVINCGFADEIKWQEKIEFKCINETDFLRESAWVILCSGMRENIVRKHFNNISLCFFEWESADKILWMKKHCIENARKYFNNLQKMTAIVSAAEKIVDYGFEKLKDMLAESPIETLQAFPFIGPVTSYHLAKNLGLPFAKSDRHLARLSNSLGFSDVQILCENISYISGDAIPVVDIVLWRFATLRDDYINVFNNK